MIKIITVGSIKEKYLKDAIEEYKKRLSKYTKLEIIEVKDEGLCPPQQAMQKESEKINKYLSEKDYIITLEIEGKELTSEEFSKKIEKASSYYVEGSMDIINNEDTYTYDVKVSYQKDNNYKVELTNISNNHKQVILRNSDGVYVMTHKSTQLL